MRYRARQLATLPLAAAAAVAITACGSSNTGARDGSPAARATAPAPASQPPATTDGAGAGTLEASAAAVAASGRGYAQATTGSGSRVKGGTVYFTEQPQAPPNYIFPMYSVEFCGLNNINDLDSVLHPPLYWFGDNYSPTVDYGASMAARPVVSNAGKTFTIHLKNYRWSDGEPLQARDLVFWMNLLKVSPLTESCNAATGLFPFNVKSYRALNKATFQLTFRTRLNPTFAVYDELSQLTPIPLAWDRTSLAQPAPKSARAKLPDATRKGAARVYAFLNKQAQNITTWAASPLWNVVNGAFKLQSATSTGQLTLVPNPHYTGSPRPSIAKLVELPFTSDTSEFNFVKASGPSRATLAVLPAQDAPQAQAMAQAGYLVNRATSYHANFFPLNLHNPRVGAIFSELYFRQALQHLINQPGWIRALLEGAGTPDYGPAPVAPPSPLVAPGQTSHNPYPYSPSAAAKLLRAHGWKVVRGGATYCARAGARGNECGAGIRRGEQIAFTVDYLSGDTTVQAEMENLASTAKQVGISIDLTQHSYNDVVGTVTPCSAKQAKCGWTAENWGLGWTYGSGVMYPAGVSHEVPTGVNDDSNYSSPKMTRLVHAAVTAAPGAERTAVSRVVAYAERQLPNVYLPSPIGAFYPAAATLISDRLGGYSTNAFGLLAPQNWYLTK